MMPTPITAAMLYDLAQCPHRVTMDLFADPADRDRVSPFVQLLWDRGTLFEKEVIANLKLPFVDLSLFAGDEKERRTYEAMDRGEPLAWPRSKAFASAADKARRTQARRVFSSLIFRRP